MVPRAGSAAQALVAPGGCSQPITVEVGAELFRDRAAAVMGGAAAVLVDAASRTPGSASLEIVAASCYPRDQWTSEIPAPYAGQAQARGGGPWG